MLGTPGGIKQHITHNITSCTGVQSLLLSGELLHYVSLPQFKSREPATNAAQTGCGPRTEHTWEPRLPRELAARRKELCFYLCQVQKSTLEQMYLRSPGE